MLKDCTPCEGPQTGAGAECEESSPEEEGAAETTCGELTTTPVPRPPAPLRGRRERNGIEAEPGNKGGVGGKVFIRFGFISHYSTLI